MGDYENRDSWSGFKSGPTFFLLSGILYYVSGNLRHSASTERIWVGRELIE